MPDAVAKSNERNGVGEYLETAFLCTEREARKEKRPRRSYWAASQIYLKWVLWTCQGKME